MSKPETVSYERRDIEPRTVLWFAVGLIGALIAAFIIIRIFAAVLGGGTPGGATHVSAPHTDVPAPRLQANPAAELAELRDDEETRLHSYGWVDRQAGVIHMPIERAMELTLERGLPARDEKQGGAR